jgi:hypothetical protein
MMFVSFVPFLCFLSNSYFTKLHEIYIHEVTQSKTIALYK